MREKTFQFRLDADTAQTLYLLAKYSKRSQADTLRLLIQVAKQLPHFKDNQSPPEPKRKEGGEHGQ